MYENKHNQLNESRLGASALPPPNSILLSLLIENDNLINELEAALHSLSARLEFVSETVPTANGIATEGCAIRDSLQNRLSTHRSKVIRLIGMVSEINQGLIL